MKSSNKETGPSSKVIVITGATRGLGRAMAEGFAALGHRVAGCGTDAEQLAALYDKLAGRVLLERVDVSDDAAVKAWAEHVLSKVGAPDLLINNAALMNEPAPLWKVPAEEFSRVIDVNIKGVATIIRHFVPAMVKTQRGVIVNFSSGWGRSVSPEVAPYCATKYAIEGLSAALAEELPAGMASVALNPGIIDTAMLRKCWPNGAAQHESPAVWAERAVPFLLKIGPNDSGKPLTVR